MDPSGGKSTDPDGDSSMTPSRMRKLNKTWTLADDVALLKNLERFSEIIINNASMTLCCMENLEDSLNNTNLKVKKVANNFQALADTQFIENRVDEEDNDVDREEPMERSASSNKPPVNLEQAIANCADVIGNKFEALHLPGIESEDERTNSNPVALIPRNAYQNRRLPHLIGSEQFMTDETLGLSDNTTSKEDEVEEEQEERVEELEMVEDDFVSLEDKEDDCSKFERKSETISFGGKQNEQIESLASSVAEKASASSYIDNFKPEILSRHLSFEPPPFSAKPPLVPPDFVDSQSSGSEEAAPGSISEESPTPSVSKGGLSKSKTFSSFKTDLAKALQARSMMPPPRSAAPKRKMSNEFDAVPRSPSMGSTSKLDRPFGSTVSSFSDVAAHEDETDRVKMDEDRSEPPPLPKTVPSFSKSKDDIFHVPKTEVLPCYGKKRARIQGRRRPPSRKTVASSPRIDNPPDEKPPTPSPTPPATSSLLSPVTDEEDLFLLPSHGIPTDLSSNNLFSSASLLSPGASIEDKPLLPVDRETAQKSEKSDNKWDPFECDDSDSDLFSSRDKPKPSTSAPSFLSEPPKKNEPPTQEHDLFGSSDEDDFLKDELFINKRFKSLNLSADKNVFGDDDDGESPFATSSSALKLPDDLARSTSSDEDDLFSTKPSKTPDSKVKTMNKTPVVKDPLLFGSDFNDE